MNQQQQFAIDFLREENRALKGTTWLPDGFGATTIIAVWALCHWSTNGIATFP
jgi:hypothetical protein